MGPPQAGGGTPIRGRSRRIVATARASSPADDKAEGLRKEIAALRLQLARKEAELRKLDPAKEVDYLDSHNLEVGTAGEFREEGLTKNGFRAAGVTPSSFKVVHVVDKTTLVVSVQRNLLLLKRFPTEAYAEGRVFYPGGMQVTGTEKQGRATLYVIEPYNLTPKQ